VAEDNNISTKVIRGMLGKLNLQPDTACNGAEALKAMKAQRYDLVLMDCEMPVLDGFSATQQLRAWEVSNQRTHTGGGADRAHPLRTQGPRPSGRAWTGIWPNRSNCRNCASWWNIGLTSANVSRCVNLRNNSPSLH
jgi:hypothetical protein